MCQQSGHAGNTGITRLSYVCFVLTDLTPPFLHALTSTLMPSHAAFYVSHFLLLKRKMKKERKYNSRENSRRTGILRVGKLQSERNECLIVEFVVADEGGLLGEAKVAEQGRTAGKDRGSN